MNLLITGTDTGVGKTVITVAMLKNARGSGIDCVGMKPICSGGNEDVIAILEAIDHAEPEHLVNPIWLRTPASPYAASVIEDRLLDMDSVRDAFQQLASSHDWVLVEGAGGLTVPITREYDFRDLARDLHLSVVIVAANRLGAINHTRLTVEAAKSAGLDCRMVVINEVEPLSEPSQASNYGLLQDLLDIPVMYVEHGQTDVTEIVNHLRGKL